MRGDMCESKESAQLQGQLGLGLGLLSILMRLLNKKEKVAVQYRLGVTECVILCSLYS